MKFECGCEWPDTEHGIEVDMDNLPDCPKVWSYLAQGRTKGVFQLEKYLGKKCCKDIMPENIDQLSAITALIRPGCIKVKDENGISTTQHYEARKNGVEKVAYFHDEAEHILGDTFGLMVYQEQSINLAKVFAGFNLKQADTLRRGIGKKKADVIASLKEEFDIGIEKTGLLSKEEGEKLFEDIKKSERYSFNKSHARAYGGTAYQTAYCKVHFPQQFYVQYLIWSKEDAEPTKEVRELVQDARMHDIEVLPPDLRDNEYNFYTKNNKIYFGLTNIKGVGQSKLDKYQIKHDTFLNFLSSAKSLAEPLIKAGACDFFKIPREKMLFDFLVYKDLTETIRSKIGGNDLLEALSKCKLKKTKKELAENEVNGEFIASQMKKIESAIKLLNNPPFSLEDTIPMIASYEEETLGLALTVPKAESEQATATCIEFNKKMVDKGMFAVEVVECRSWAIKTGANKGKMMGKAVLQDSTGIIENATIFNSAWETCGYLFAEGNTLLIDGEKSWQDDSFVVRNAWQI